MDCVRRFLREDLQPGMDKLLFIGKQSRVFLDEEAAFEALQLLVMLASGMLRYRQQQSPEVLQELDADMTPLMNVVLSAFNNQRPLHQRVAAYEVPEAVLAKYGAFDAPDEVQWVQPKLDDEASMQLQDEDLDDMQDDVQEVLQWWSHIVQTFGNMQGFEVIIEVGAHGWPAQQKSRGGGALPLLQHLKPSTGQTGCSGGSSVQLQALYHCAADMVASTMQ